MNWFTKMLREETEAEAHHADLDMLERVLEWRPLNPQEQAQWNKLIAKTPMKNNERYWAAALVRNIDETTPGGYHPKPKGSGLMALIGKVWLAVILALGFVLLVAQVTKAEPVSPTVGRIQ